MIHITVEVSILVLVLQHCRGVGAQSCAVSEACCADDTCSNVRKVKGEQGDRGLKGETGEDRRGYPGDPGMPGAQGSIGKRGLKGETGEMGQKGNKGLNCTCKPEKLDDVKAEKATAELSAVDHGLAVAVCLLYVFILCIVAVLIYLTRKNKAAFDSFRNVLLSARQTQVSPHQDEDHH